MSATLRDARIVVDDLATAEQQKVDTDVEAVRPAGSATATGWTRA